MSDPMISFRTPITHLHLKRFRGQIKRSEIRRQHWRPSNYMRIKMEVTSQIWMRWNLHWKRTVVRSKLRGIRRHQGKVISWRVSSNYHTIKIKREKYCFKFLKVKYRGIIWIMGRSLSCQDLRSHRMELQKWEAQARWINVMNVRSTRAWLSNLKRTTTKNWKRRKKSLKPIDSNF